MERKEDEGLWKMNADDEGEKKEDERLRKII